jgi:hypothetical protein
MRNYIIPLVALVIHVRHCKQTKQNQINGYCESAQTFQIFKTKILMEDTSEDTVHSTSNAEVQEDSSPPEVGEIKEGYETILPQSETPEDFEEQYEEQQSYTPSESPSPIPTEENANQPPPSQKFAPEDIVTHNIFVGDLKSDVVEQDLFDAFRPCGEIHSVHIFRDPHTQEQKGFGFVHFMTREAQQKALSDEFKNIAIKVSNDN